MSAAPVHPLVLLVDDDEDLLASMEKALLREDFRVVTAASGAAALTLVQQLDERPDVLVIDIFLPDSWGSSLAFTIQQSFPGIRIIYISGYTRDDPILKGFEDPDVVLLPKPFEFHELATTIRQRLSH